MKKIILVIILMLNLGGFVEINHQKMGNTASGQLWSWIFKKKGIPCPDDPQAPPSQGNFVTRAWNWLISLFPGKEDRVQEIEQIATGCEYDNSETYNPSYTSYNYYNFDWYIIDDDGERRYYNPGGGGDYTIGEIDILSRLGQYAAEFFVLNPDLDLGRNTTGHYITVNGSTTKYYNNSNIVLQNYGNASVNLQIHSTGDGPQGPSIPNGTVDDPNPASETYDWYVNNAFMGTNPELHINPGTQPTSVKVKKSTGEVVLNASIQKKEGSIFITESNDVFVSPDGVPFKLPAGSKIKTYNIDTDNFTNGAVYGFIGGGSDSSEYVFKDETSFKGTSGTPRFTTAVKVIDDGAARTYSTDTDTYTGFTYPARTNSPIEVIRIRKVKENGICKILIEKVSYTVPKDVANTLSDTPRPQNTAIEDAPLIALVNSITVPCPESLSGNSRNGEILKEYMKVKKHIVKEFLQNKVKNNVKFYLADSTGSKVKYTITKTAADSLTTAQQTGATDKFNNGNFTAADEDIAIKMYLEDGKWQYEVKYNPNKIQPNAKIAPVLQQVKDEIKRQADDEVRKLRVPKSESNAVEEQVGGGEKFAKAKMDMLQAIAAIYDVGKEIINEGKMPENIWDNGSRTTGTTQSVKDKYDQSAFNAPSLVGGGVDQLIDEATGAVQLVKAGLEIVRKPVESAKGLWNTVKALNKDKIKQFALDASGITNYQQGGSRATYQAGMHGVKLAMIVAAGVKVLTEGKELVEKAAKEVDDIQKFIPDGTTNHAATDALKNAAENRKIVQKIDEDKLLTKNVEGGQTKVVALEKDGNEVKAYKVNQDELKDARSNTVYTAEEIAESAKDVQKSKTVTYINGRKTIETEAGSTGSWSKDLNKPEPDADYHVKNSGSTPHKYKTDADGRVVKVEGELKLSSRNRNGYQQSVKCKGSKDGLSDDHGSHLIGSRFDGAGEQINLVPMKSDLNLREWKVMENEWEKALQQGKTVNIEIRPIYDGTSKRPIGFEVDYWIDGIKTSEVFEN
ncbi:DNA/RNA non-specific endonuclease [Polluticaenibacter yanchengensis]|uniref:DNA/RNA non-specific endonuclease n=1 Tax=Polluticaenibacter yanchengensis TaxID=3014562 RepID=A0ABT4UNZ3_9BACT|nr:DNA/RNA non-specific endonuclease [Chitinophagaceae bacterium LY-5]